MYIEHSQSVQFFQGNFQGGRKF